MKVIKTPEIFEARQFTEDVDYKEFMEWCMGQINHVFASLFPTDPIMTLSLYPKERWPKDISLNAWLIKRKSSIVDVCSCADFKAKYKHVHTTVRRFRTVAQGKQEPVEIE